ncbi:MAG: phosphoglycerate dehydrogenase [Bacteroidota bacterium]
MSAETLNPPKTFVVIDFDSTFMKVEALEELADIVLEGSEEKASVLQEIKDITDLGVDGKIGFNESLTRRLGKLQATRKDLDKLIERLKGQVSTSFTRNKAFFDKYKGQVYIISNGFKDFIDPVVAEYSIPAEFVFANTFTFDDAGNITGFDGDNLLAHSKGKSRTLKSLDLPGEIYVIGDAYTDYEMKEAGIAHKFFAFTENVLREHILDKADHITPSFDEFLYVNQMPRAISYPKNRIKVLLLENIHPGAFAFFEEEGYQVEVISGALSEEELCEKIKDVSILGIRSKTQVTQKVIEAANRLLVVGAFCIGTNQIDLEACAMNGTIVFNAPFSNTRSVVELAIGEIIMLMRRIPTMSHRMHKGVWNKSAANSFEVRGKKLGIVGYGNIGAQLSVLAESLGMEVYYYDVVEKLALGNATKMEHLHDLLRKVDIVTLHVDGRKENKLIFGDAEFEAMRQGAIFLNLSRGFVVDIKALTENVTSGKLLGAAVDVFPQEPKTNNDEFVSELIGLENVILTPHIGGSTQEAQQDIGKYVPRRIVDYINTGNTFGSVNFPNLQLPSLKDAHRLIHVHKNTPGILARINNVLAHHEINIVGQYLKTNEGVGYVITDINKAYSKQVLQDLREIEHTIKFRVLY